MVDEGTGAKFRADLSAKASEKAVEGRPTTLPGISEIVWSTKKGKELDIISFTTTDGVIVKKNGTYNFTTTHSHGGYPISDSRTYLSFTVHAMSYDRYTKTIGISGTFPQVDAAGELKKDEKGRPLVFREVIHLRFNKEDSFRITPLA